MPLPTLHTLAHADRGALTRDAFAACMYFVGGGLGPGGLVLARIAANEEALRSGQGGVSGSGASTTFSGGMLMCPAANPESKEDVVLGVKDGGVVELKRGDTFTVPGWMVRQPLVATVQVRVGLKIKLVDGVWWHAEVTL